MTKSNTPKETRHTATNERALGKGRFTLRLLCLLVACIAGEAAAARIACVGESVTWGWGLTNRAQQSYPVLLQGMLGVQHTVRNFGTSGCTVLKKGDKPYWKDANFKASTEFKPDVVVLMFGSNDAKPQNWRYTADFSADCAELISHYRALGARVYLVTPPPIYGTGKFGITPGVVNASVVPLVRETAAGSKVPLIDMFTALSGKPECFLDTVHPNAEGAKVIAQTVAAALSRGGLNSVEARGQAPK
jgi:acyl-CoA thioesterase I